MTIDLTWRADLLGAVILSDGSFVGALSIEPWWPEPKGEPDAAWVAGYMNGATNEYVKACVERPAAEVTEDRRGQMLEQVREAIMAGPPSLPGPERTPAPMKLTGEEVEEQVRLVIAAWVAALDDLWRDADTRDPTLTYSLYIKLAHVLNWAYTVDGALQAAWNQVPPRQQVTASQDADAKIAAAIADRQSRPPSSWNPAEDATFRPYLRRKAEKRPYDDWASMIVAGAFHEEFFSAVEWVSGKMRHGIVQLPIELRQMTPGGEPRWKWKLANAIVPEFKDRDAERVRRDLYAAHLQEKDVLGLFSWLVDVFASANRLIGKLRRDADAAGD